MTNENAAALVVEDPIVSTPEIKDEVKNSELDELREQIENSKKETERERQRAESAEREREEYSKKLSVESTERVKAQGNSIESMIAAKQSEAERLKREIKEAHESGKFDEYAELVSDYSTTKQEIKNYEAHKAQVAAQEQNRIESIKNDPLANYSAKEKQWISNHPDFLTDTRYQARVSSAHYAAIADGIRLDSDDYFNFIDNHLEPKESKEEKEDNPPPKKVSTSLPPSRSGSSSSSSGSSKSIRLTPDEVEAAMWSFPKMSAADAQNEYYKQKLEAIKDGKIGRN